MIITITTLVVCKFYSEENLRFSKKRTRIQFWPMSIKESAYRQGRGPTSPSRSEIFKIFLVLVLSEVFKIFLALVRSEIFKFYFFLVQDFKNCLVRGSLCPFWTFVRTKSSSWSVRKIFSNFAGPSGPKIVPENFSEARFFSRFFGPNFGFFQTFIIFQQKKSRMRHSNVKPGCLKWKPMITNKLPMIIVKPTKKENV